LLRVTAAGVTPLDHTILSGHFPLAKAPLVLGNEGAGVVEEGAGTDFPIGSRVMFTGPYGVLIGAYVPQMYAGGPNGYRAALERRQLTPGLISSFPGTAGLPPFISFPTSYPERTLPRYGPAVDAHLKTVSVGECCRWSRGFSHADFERDRESSQ
jgi:hypothetical protein